MPALDDYRAHLRRELERLEVLGQRRQLRPPQGIDLTSNDILGFALHPHLRERMLAALAVEPAGAGASRLLRGHLALFDDIEERLAAFCGTPSTLLFNSGYAANTGLLQTLLGPDDLVLSDAANHASLIDGIRLSGTPKIVYPHQDLAAVDDALRRPRRGRAFVVTESLFGMDGDLTPLVELVELAERHAALVIVDEAHATGLFGRRGAGRVEELGLRERVLATVHTGGKALGSSGAWVAGSPELRELLLNRARPFVFTTAPLPVLAAALHAALDLVEREPERRVEVRRKSELLRTALRRGGAQVGVGAHIVPLLVGENAPAVALQTALLATGFDARAVRPPTVPPGTARLRVSVRYPLSDLDLERFAAATLQALAEARGSARMTPEDIRRWDVDHVWHPFSQMSEYAAHDPLVFVDADGHYLIDDRGRRLFDATSALWCNLFGHKRPEIDAAIREQLGRFAHTTLLGASHPAVAELARRLVEIAPTGLEHVFFSDNGATAVEAALKIAFQYRLLTQGREAAAKAVYLSFDNAYHGDTLGAAAVGGVELFHDLFRPILIPTLKTPSPYCYRCPVGKTPDTCSIDCADELEAVLEREGGRVCAVLLEPGVQAAAGILVLPDGFLAKVAAACRKHGALLILDEVATGFGRTGALFACQREGVTPDLMCLGKGLTGGYLPVAATLATDAVYREFLGRYEDYRHFFHGHTYTGNALGCAAALATLRILQDGRVVGDVARKGRLLREALAPLESHRHVGELRSAGLMCGIELVADRGTKAAFAPGDRVGFQLGLAARGHGVFMRPLGDVLVLMPPLTSTDDELRHLAGTVRAVMTERFGG